MQYAAIRQRTNIPLLNYWRNLLRQYTAMALLRVILSDKLFTVPYASLDVI
jgi:hypothetical protein